MIGQFQNWQPLGVKGQLVWLLSICGNIQYLKKILKKYLHCQCCLVKRWNRQLNIFPIFSLNCLLLGEGWWWDGTDVGSGYFIHFYGELAKCLSISKFLLFLQFHKFPFFKVCPAVLSIIPLITFSILQYPWIHQFDSKLFLLFHAFYLLMKYWKLN